MSSSSTTLRDHYLARATRKAEMLLRSGSERLTKAALSVNVEEMESAVEDMNTMVALLRDLRYASAAADLSDQPSHDSGDDGL